MRWMAVGKIGRIIRESLPGGRSRIRIDFGRRQGKRIRLDSVPSPLDGRPIPLADEATAARVLESVRAAMADGKTLEQALWPFRAKPSAQDLVQARLQRWIGHLEDLVELGQRSPTYLREIRRYARADGHFSWWAGRPIHGITYGDVEDWQLWLARRDIAAKTQKNVSDAFRAFLRWLKRRGEVAEVPDFPTVQVPEYAPATVDLGTQWRVIEAIPWDRRGAFLVAATEALRIGEIRALNLDDFRDGRLRVSKAIQGPRLDAPTRHTKTRASEWRELWNPELLRWIAWRLQQATPERRLRGEVALFWNPTARNPAKRWTPDPMECEWRRACDAVGVKIALQEGTRHTMLTALGSTLPDRMLQAFSRHRDWRSLSRYAKPRPTADAITRALRGPWLDPDRDTAEETDATTERCGGADGTRTRNFRRDRPVL